MQNIPAAARLLRRHVRCGKPGCRPCAAGTGHGPYWYASWREGGKVRQRYLGRTTPPGYQIMSAPEPPLNQSPIPPSNGNGARARATPGLQGPRAAPEARLQIRLFGCVEVERDGVRVPHRAWRRSPAKSLLGMLLIADRQQLMREVIADHLFPDASAADARTRLTDALHHLRNALEPERSSRQPSRYILQDGPLVRFCLNQETWVDYHAFNRALAVCDRADPTLEQLREAVDCYGGDLLPHEQGDWCVSKREGHRLRWHELLRRYGLAQHRHGLTGAALDTFQRLFDDSPGDDVALPMIVRLLLEQQRRSDARRYLQHAYRVLRKEEDLSNSALLEAGDLLGVNLRRGFA